jgi:hypothetical protein
MITINGSNRNKTTNELLCGEWTLVKMTVISEKTIYEGELNNLLNFNCETNSWTIVEDGELHSSGKWKLKNSSLELLSNSEQQNVKINALSKNHLSILFPDVVCEYIRE